MRILSVDRGVAAPGGSPLGRQSHWGTGSIL